jgi:hypothetical protein
MIKRAKSVAVLSPVAWRTPPRHYGAWETVASNLAEGLVDAAGTPLDAMNAASISGQSMPSGLALQRAIMASSQAAPNAPKNGT